MQIKHSVRRSPNTQGVIYITGHFPVALESNRFTTVKHLKEGVNIDSPIHPRVSTGDLNFIPDHVRPNYNQLLKWIGNKQRYAHHIASHFPKQYRHYYEPFLGSAGMLGVLKPRCGFASDVFAPLIDIWQHVKENPDTVKIWYADSYRKFEIDSDYYYEARERYNLGNNPADLLFITRACYGGIIRFRKSDGFISTPIGSHKLMLVDTFNSRVDEWHQILKNIEIEQMDYKESISRASKNDFVYCDPPYNNTQKILYGSHSFNMEELLSSISECKIRGATVALSIDTLSDQLKDSMLFEQIISVSTGKQKLNNFYADREAANRTEFLLISNGEDNAVK